jgi:hypothetical protein
MWKRHKVFQLWCDQIKVLQKEVDAEIIPLAVGSEGSVSKQLAELNGVVYHEFPNLPLGRKANHRLQMAKSLSPDYILFLGSDDIICPELLKHQIELAKDYDVIEVKDIYYYDTRSRVFVYCQGYTNHRKGEPLAVARFVNTKVFDKIGWSVWNENKRRGIDSDFHKKLNQFNRKQIKIKDRFLVLDIKTSENISKFDVTRNNWKIVSQGFVSRKLHSNFTNLMRI